MKKPQSYKDLDIYTIANELAVSLHRITIEEVPRFEMYEEGSQIRRSSKSIVSNIVRDSVEGDTKTSLSSLYPMQFLLVMKQRFI